MLNESLNDQTSNYWSFDSIDSRILTMIFGEMIDEHRRNLRR